MTLSCHEQLRRDLLLKALEVFRDTETAMAATLEMECFVFGRDSDTAAGPRGFNVEKNDTCSTTTDGHYPSAACEVGRRRRWTDADDGLLRRLWSDGFTASAISQRLNRSEASVATRASVLKLKRAADRPLLRATEEPRNGQSAVPLRDTAVVRLDVQPPPAKVLSKAEVRTIDRPLSCERAGAASAGSGTADRVDDDLPDGAIDSVIRFLRSRDYSVVRTDDGLFRLDEREDLTTQELLSRANRVRAYLQQPPFPAMAS